MPQPRVGDLRVGKRQTLKVLERRKRFQPAVGDRSFVQSDKAQLRTSPQVGQSFIGDYAPVLPSLLRLVIVYLLTFAMVYIIASVIDLLAARFGGQRNFANAVKLSVYSHTPLWLAGIFLLIPGLNFLLILGIYGLYLLWTGLPLLMQVPDEKALPYAAVVTACALVPAVVLAIV